LIAFVRWMVRAYRNGRAPITHARALIPSNSGEACRVLPERGIYERRHDPVERGQVLILCRFAHVQVRQMMAVAPWIEGQRPSGNIGCTRCIAAKAGLIVTIHTAPPFVSLPRQFTSPQHKEHFMNIQE
jgi:hypothetical protein